MALPVLGGVFTAQATPITLKFSPTGLGTMDGTYAYKWGINWTVPTDNVITAASLAYTDVKLTTYGINNPGILWTNLLDTTSGSGTTGVTAYTDWDAGTDYWGSTGLVGKALFPTLNVAQSFSYALDLAMLKTYAGDGHFAMGIDPDCYYKDTSIVLSISYDQLLTPGGSQVPDGGSTALLLGLALPLLRMFRRSK